jgi:hypothetical protein
MIPVGIVEERDDSEAEEEIRDLRDDDKALDVGMEPKFCSLGVSELVGGCNEE